MKNANAPAFPRPDSIDEQSMELLYDGKGLTKREYFAAMLMQGVSSNSTTRATIRDLAKVSVEAADALLAELAK